MSDKVTILLKATIDENRLHKYTAELIESIKKGDINIEEAEAVAMTDLHKFVDIKIFKGLI